MHLNYIAFIEGQGYFFAAIMINFKKVLILKITSISLIFLLGISSDLYSFSRDYLRIPLDGKWKERAPDVIEHVSQSMAGHENTARFNPLKKPISWAGSLRASGEKPIHLDSWVFTRRSFEDTSTPQYFKNTIDIIFPAEIPYRDIIIKTLSKLEYFPTIKGMKGICYIWSCMACYILKDLPFIEEVKILRTIDDEHTWLAFKFKNIDKWYAFDRAMGYFVKYTGDYKYGLYEPIEEAEKAAVYFSEQNNYELEYSSDDELIDGVSKNTYIRNALKALKEDTLLSFIERYDSDGMGLYKDLYGQIRDFDIKLCEHKKEVGISYCCQIIKDVQYWMKKLGPNDPIVIHFCTGDTPWIGYTYLAEFLKNWDKSEVQAILKTHGIDLSLKPQVDRITAYPMDGVFPQKRTEYHSFHNILNNMFDRLGIKKENRRFFYGDLIMDESGKGYRIMTDEEFDRLTEDIDKKGLLLERDDNTGVSKIIADPETDALQYRFLKAMEQQALDLSDELRKKYGGAHITTGGIGPGYKGEGHFAFDKTGDRFDKSAFIAPADYHVRSAHCKEMNGMKETYVRINGQIKPIYGTVTFSFKDLLFRQDRQNPENGVRTIIIAEGPQKSNSLYTGIEEKGPPSYEKPMKQIRMTDSKVTFVTEEACASKLSLFEHPWWFKPIKDWTASQKKQFFIRLAKLRNKKIQDLTVDDFLRFGPKESYNPMVEVIKKYNLSTLCRRNSWDELKREIVKDIQENIIRPDEFAYRGSKWAKRLGLDKEKAKVTYIKPHLDDDYLADRHKIEAMVKAGCEVSAYFLAKGYTAVDDDYAINIMSYMQNWDIHELSEILKEDEEKLLYELMNIATARKDYRDPHDYDPWKSMSSREKDIRAKLLYININKRSGLILDSVEKIKSLSAFLTKANTLKPRGGNRDISLVQDIKVYIRLTEEQTALISLGVKYENIHSPEDSSWYGSAGRGGTAMEGDVEIVKFILERENPDLVISNGENFPDYGAHSTTENSVTTALLELLEQGKIKNDIKYMQSAGVWERIKAEESQVGFLLTEDEIREFEINFIHLYPSQAPPVVPDSNFEDIVHFSTQVRLNANASVDEIVGVTGTLYGGITVPEGYGILNYKIIDLKDGNTIAALIKKRNDLEDNRIALKKSSNENLNGAIPLPDIASMDKEIELLEESGLHLADFVTVQELEHQLDNAMLPQYRIQAVNALTRLGSREALLVLDTRLKSVEELIADMPSKAEKEFNQAMASMGHILKEAEEIIAREKNQIVVDLELGKLKTKAIDAINKLRNSGYILKDLNVFERPPNAFRDRYYDMLASAALSFPQEIGLGNYADDIHSIIAEEFSDVGKKYLWDIFSRHETTLDKKSLKRIRFGIPIITQPLRTLKKLKSLQEEMGNLEIDFAIIYPQKALYPLVIIIGGGDDRARDFLDSYLLSSGHTHGFNAPLKVSSEDYKISKDLYSDNGAISFVLGLDRGGDFELAVYNPRFSNFIYERKDQEKIAEKLRELHFLASKSELREREVMENEVSNGRYSNFSERMILANKDKIRMCKFVVSGSIIELGTGVGNVTGLVREKFPDSEIVGIDYNATFLQQASQSYPDITFYQRNILKWHDFDNFKGKFNTVIISSTLHEIDVPYGREASEQVFRLAHALLKDGGVLIFRDGVKPENKELGVEFILKTPYAKKKFELFIKEYRHRNIKFSYVNEAKTRVIVSPYDLHDILCKYYFEGDLWTRDMDESFGQMNEQEYRKLIENYFVITHSETYIAPYLQVLWERDFEIVNGEYPNSHILIAAKKVRNKIKPLIGQKLSDQKAAQEMLKEGL